MRCQTGIDSIVDLPCAYFGLPGNLDSGRGRLLTIVNDGGEEHCDKQGEHTTMTP